MEQYYIPATLSITLVGALLTMVMRDSEAAKKFALVVSFVPLAFGVLAMRGVKFGATAYDAASMSFHTSYDWITSIGASLTFGIDGISAPMVFLTGLLTPLVIWFSWDVKERASTYFGLMLLLEFAVIGVFTTLDYFAFYIFWELVLIPMFVMILVWGGPNKRYAAVKFLTYTFIASLVMLIGIMALYVKTGLGTFDMLEIAAVAPGLDKAFQTAVFATFLVGFGTKMPLVPVHTWLPDAHVQAPTGGSVMLAGVLLKLGSYGFLRIAMPTLPEGFLELQPLMILIALVSLVYTTWVALGQRDLKSIIAYSSISHMGAAFLGFLTLNQLGIVGGLFMMFAHGLISPALFMGAGVIQHATGTRLVPELGGIASKMPKGIAIIMVAFMASLGLPGLAGFVAEVLIFLGTYQAFGFTLVIATLAIPFTAAYYLFAAKRAFFGELTTRIPTDDIHDAKAYEFWPIMILMILTLAYGVYPSMMTDMLSDATSTVLNHMGYGDSLQAVTTFDTSMFGGASGDAMHSMDAAHDAAHAEAAAQHAADHADGGAH